IGCEAKCILISSFLVLANKVIERLTIASLRARDKNSVVGVALRHNRRLRREHMGCSGHSVLPLKTRFDPHTPSPATVNHAFGSSHNTYNIERRKAYMHFQNL